MVESRSPEYRAWSHMRRRCFDTKATAYPRYGAKGIIVCPQWRNDFAAFLADMGRKPSPAHSIDRINNDGNYTPKNCRWATFTEQQNNKRNNMRVFYRGIEMTLAEAVRAAGSLIDQRLARSRIIRDGWTTERAVETTKLSHPSGERNGRAKLTAADAAAIRSSTKLGVELAADYGVSHQAISKIRRGERWLAKARGEAP